MTDFNPTNELSRLSATDPLLTEIAMRFPVSKYPDPDEVARLMSAELYQHYQTRVKE